MQTPVSESYLFNSIFPGLQEDHKLRFSAAPQRGLESDPYHTQR